MESCINYIKKIYSGVNNALHSNWSINNNVESGVMHIREEGLDVGLDILL